MAEKLIGLKEAAALIPDGATISFGGFTTQRHPMAFVYELIRLKRRNPYLFGHSPGGDWDVLIGAGCVKRTVIIALHAKRRFPEKIDYITSPGWLQGGDSRFKSGLIRGGPSAMVTTKGVMRFRHDTKDMYLASYHPGLTAQAVADDTGFALDTSNATETPVPALEELHILREVVDPERVFLK